MESKEREDYLDQLKLFKAKLPIDQFKLEVECAEQAMLYDEVGEWVSEIKSKARVAKDHVDFTKADLSLKIRKSPETFGLVGKVTEGCIDAVITVSDEYQGAIKESMEADKFAYDASILLASVEQRKSMLRDEVRLFVFGFYNSTDVIPQEDWKKSEAAITALRNAKKENEGDISQEDDVGEV